MVLRLCKRSAEKPKATAECIFGLKETGYITIPKQYCVVCRNAVSVDYWRFVRHSIVAYKTGTEQSVNLVLRTIKADKKKEKVTAELQLHSDQGFQYTSHPYFKLT